VAVNDIPGIVEVLSQPQPDFESFMFIARPLIIATPRPRFASLRPSMLDHGPSIDDLETVACSAVRNWRDAARPARAI
jgi:hypothetical protein